MEALAIVAIVFLLLKSGILNSLSLGSQVLPNGQPAPSSFVPNAYGVRPDQWNQQPFQLAQQGVQQVTATVTSDLSQAAQEGSDVAGGLAKAVPIIGSVVSAIIGVFAAASAKRAKEATSENSAVSNAFPGWDRMMLAIQQAYNSGQINRAQAFTLVDAGWQNYWNEVTPFIQPGRNGCQGGSMSKQDADARFPGMAQCSGSWGAACCVGYADLANGTNSIKAAIAQTDNTGSAAVAYIPAVYASKYGGANRASYTLTFQRPSTTFSL